VTWKDAKLTSNGYNQAANANKFWKETAVTEGIPAPEIMYTNPLTRALQTATLTFADTPFLTGSKGIVVSGVSLPFN
jgi:bisphosphoglycerate-dependent phosphoglycerate mutase